MCCGSARCSRIGDITLAAIVDRVLYTASERFPVLTSLELQSTGICFDGLRAQIDALDSNDLAHGMRFALLELLTVLGHLTAEIPTPALHAELERVARDELGASEAITPGGRVLQFKLLKD